MDGSILRNGVAFAITVAIGYVACAALFAVFPDAAATFMNALFHGLDFRKLQPANGGFDFAGFTYAAIVLALWAFALGCLFGALRRYFAEPDRVTL